VTELGNMRHPGYSTSNAVAIMAITYKLNPIAMPIVPIETVEFFFH